MGPTAVRTPPTDLPEVSGRAMSGAQHDAAVRPTKKAWNIIQPSPTQTKSGGSLPTTPQTLSAMTSEEGFREAISDLLGGGKSGLKLANSVLKRIPADDKSETPYAAALVAATALKSAGAENAGDARALLLAACSSKNATPQTFRFERILAASGDSGLSALEQLKTRKRSGMPDNHVDSLNLCADLESHGVNLSQCRNAADVLTSLKNRPGLARKMDRPVGGVDDDRLQLLAKALRHSQEGSRSHPSDFAAYFAWKKGGFTESGEGTPFNRTIGRMHKFMAYVDRADHGPRTLGRMAQDVRSAFGRMVGVGKSPLSVMRHGTLGADHALRHEQHEKWQNNLKGAIKTAVENLKDELRDPQIGFTDAQRNPRVARAAVLDLWQTEGRTKFTLDEISQRCNRILDEAGIAWRPDDRTLRQSLGKFTNRARTEDGSRGYGVSISTLESIQSSRVRGREGGTAAAADPADLRTRINQLRSMPQRNDRQNEELRVLQAQRRDAVSNMLSEMKGLEKAGPDTNPLFKFSDLKVLLRGTPRQGPTSQDAQNVLKSIAGAKIFSPSSFSDGAARGIGTVGSVPLASSALGVPVVFPILQAEAGKRAVISVGVNATSARLHIGTQTTHSGSIGAGGGWAAPPLLGDKLAVAAVAAADVTHQVSHTEGATILARKDKPGWQQTVPNVIDFLFQEARENRGQAPHELWQGFAERFKDDEHLALSWTSERSAATSAGVGAIGIARGAVSSKTNIGPAVSIGVRAQGSQFSRSANAMGGDVPSSAVDRGVTTTAAVTIGQTAPMLATAGGPVLGWGVTSPLAGASIQWDHGTGMGFATLARDRNGQISAGLCTREVIFQDSKKLAAYVNRSREEWETTMAAADTTRGPGAARTAARERLNNYLKVALSEQSGINLHGETRVLKQGVADKINVYEARLRAIKGTGDKTAEQRPLSANELRECAALEHEMDRLFKDESSWRPDALYVAEQNAISGSTGLNFGLKAVSREQADSLHLTQLLTPSPPAAPDPVGRREP